MCQICSLNRWSKEHNNQPGQFRQMFFWMMEDCRRKKIQDQVIKSSFSPVDSENSAGLTGFFQPRQLGGGGGLMVSWLRFLKVEVAMRCFCGGKLLGSKMDKVVVFLQKRTHPKYGPKWPNGCVYWKLALVQNMFRSLVRYDQLTQYMTNNNICT